MKTGNYTPGPWGTRRVNGSYYITAESDLGRDGITRARSIAKLVKSGFGDSAQANLSLMRAAPDLLAALELAEATIKRLNRHDSANGTLDVVRAAIAKAVGGQS